MEYYIDCEETTEVKGTSPWSRKGKDKNKSGSNNEDPSTYSDLTIGKFKQKLLTRADSGKQGLHMSVIGKTIGPPSPETDEMASQLRKKSIQFQYDLDLGKSSKRTQPIENNNILTVRGMSPNRPNEEEQELNTKENELEFKLLSPTLTRKKTVGGGGGKIMSPVRVRRKTTTSARISKVELTATKVRANRYDSDTD